MDATDPPEVQNSYHMGPDVGLGAIGPGSYGQRMGATDATEPTAEQHDHPRRRAAAARLAVASGLGATALVALADVAHARIALNHNETAGRDRR